MKMFRVHVVQKNGQSLLNLNETYDVLASTASIALRRALKAGREDLFYLRSYPLEIRRLEEISANVL